MAGETLLTKDEFYSNFNPSSLQADRKGNLWASYSGIEGDINIKNISEKNQFTLCQGKGKGCRGFVMKVEDNNIYMAWREKTAEGKKLYFQAIYDGKDMSAPVLLDDNSTEALTRIKIDGDSKGNVYVVWYGERMVDASQYHTYVAVSNDFGKTFSMPKILTRGYYSSIYPTILTDENHAYVFSYSVSVKDNKYLMLFYKTTDNGKTWSAPAVIRELAGTVTLFIEPVKIGKRLHVFWYTTSEEGPMVEHAYSDDEGNTWKTRIFEETSKFSTTLFKVANDNSGNIYMALSGRTDTGKDHVYMISSRDNGSTWGSLKDIRHYPYETTSAKNPLVIAHDGGKVVVIWNDYRNIRRNIYLQYSLDGGNTWQEKDIPIEEPGKLNTSYWPYTAPFLFSGDRYYLLASRFKDDVVLEAADLMLVDFGLGGQKQ
jgi:hypothetical protein